MTVSVTLPQLRAWIQVPVSVVTDEQLGVLLDAETANQASSCRVDPLLEQPALVAALQRRVSRAVAARTVPLGLLGDSEFGPVALRRFDSEIERMEAPYRRFVFA